MNIRRVAGQQAQSAGSTFESWLEAQHEKAIRSGILAHIEHNQPHAKIINGRLIYVESGVSDYTGVLDNKVATSVAIEAKSSKIDRLAYSVIKRKQADHLDAVAHAGGLALLLAEFRHEALPRRFAIPWLEVPWAILRSAKSISSTDVAQWEISRDPAGCYLSRFHEPGPKSLPKKTWEPPR